MGRIAWLGALSIAVLGCDRAPPPPPRASPTRPPPPPQVSPAGPPERIASTVATDPPAAPGSTAPNMVASGDAVLATWLEPIAPRAHRMRFARFASNQWSKPSTVAEGTEIVANWADVPSVARQADGTLVAHWTETSGPNAYASAVIVARSTDDGVSWQRLGSPHRDRTATEHGFVSLVPDGDTVLALWLDGRAVASGAAGATMLRAARIGEAIGEEQVVDERVCDCCSTSAASTADGPVVVYRDRSADELRDPFVARRGARAWSLPRAIHGDGWKIAGCPVNGPTVAASGREVVAAWYTYADQRPAVHVAFSGDAGATFDRPIEVDAPRGARTPIGRVDVVLDRPGEALVSWLASEREDGRLLVRRVARDGRRGTELALATIAAAREGGFPRVEPLRDDIVFAWTDTRAKTIRAARLPRTDVPAVTTDEPITASKIVAVEVGRRAPDYRAVASDGTQVSLAGQRGAVLLNVWATWCEPCRQELPILNELRARFEDRGLRVVAVSVDRTRSRDEVSALARRFADKLDVWYDLDDRASQAFGITALPATLLFDATGVLVWRHDGAITRSVPGLEKALADVLAP